MSDDDPRLRQPHRPQPTRPGTSQGAPTGSQAAGLGGGLAAGFGGFDFSRPAVKVVPRPDAVGGIPGVELFGLPVPGPGLLAVAAAGVFFGLRGLLAAAALGYMYLRTSGAATGAAAAAGRPAGRTAAASGGIFMQQQQQEEGGFGSPLRQQHGQGSTTQSSGAFQGKAYKLRDS